MNLRRAVPHVSNFLPMRIVQYTADSPINTDLHNSGGGGGRKGDVSFMNRSFP